VASILALAASIVAAYAARHALTHTPAGAVVSAVAQDLVAARLVGLPVWVAVLAVYAFAGAVAAVGGILYASTFGIIKLSIGWTATVVAFTAAIIGGRHSLVGAVVGGLALGIATTFLAYVLPSGYRDAIVFLLLAVVIVVRPGRSTQSVSTVSAS
jgi:branched-chain amino acid transport system permease protein